MKQIIKALAGGFGFLTTVPIGTTKGHIDAMSHHMYVFPVIGLAVGLVVGGVGYLVTNISTITTPWLVPPQLLSILLIILLYYITGINHLDAMADFGDGLVAHGTVEKKVSAMKDTYLGIGAVIFTLISILMLFVLISQALMLQPAIFLAAVMVSEVCAKQAMLTVATFGHTIHKGLGSVSSDNATPTHFAFGVLFSGFVCASFLGIAGLVALFMALALSALIIRTAIRHFGGINGDVIGSSNEMARLISLATIIIFVPLIPILTNGGLSWTLW